MTTQTIIVFAIFGAMSFLFIQGKVRHDLTALMGLLALVFSGILKPEEAFLGFSSPTMIIMISTFFIGEAFFDTGVADKIGRLILKLCAGKERGTILLLTAVTSSLATFIGTIATTIIMMPVAAYISRRAGISPSRLFIPISFGSVMGGTATMLGTRANMIASDILSANNIKSFSLFSFTPVGLAIIGSGLAIITILAPKVLAIRVLNSNSRDDNISEIYGLKNHYC